MIKKILLVCLLISVSLSANKVYVVSYIKNQDIKNQVREFYKSFNDKFIDVEIIYKEPKSNEFYNDFRTNGLSFLSNFMVKNKYDATLIFYQKRAKKKISILSQKQITNVSRNINISSKKFTKNILYEKLIAESLKMLGELLIIKSQNRVL